MESFGRVFVAEGVGGFGAKASIKLVCSKAYSSTKHLGLGFRASGLRLGSILR